MAKAGLIVKFVALGVYIRKEEESQISNPSPYYKNLNKSKIKNISQNATFNIILNGERQTDFLRLGRLQGHSLSSLLFHIEVECPSNTIRQERK